MIEDEMLDENQRRDLMEELSEVIVGNLPLNEVISAAQLMVMSDLQTLTAKELLEYAKAVLGVDATADILE